jgi:hypothetical protein
MPPRAAQANDGLSAAIGIAAARKRAEMLNRVQHEERKRIHSYHFLIPAKAGIPIDIEKQPEQEITAQPQKNPPEGG